MLSCVCLFETLWPVARQSPLSVGLSRQGYWSGLPFPTQGDLPDPGIKPVSPVLAGGLFLPLGSPICIYQPSNLKLPVHPSPSSSPLGNHKAVLYVYAHSISCVKALASSGFLYDLIIWEHLYLASDLAGSWWILDRNQRPFPIQLALNKTVVEKEPLMHLLSHFWFN